jgi:hypothetical protein
MIGRIEFEIILRQCGYDGWNWLSLVFRSLVISSGSKRIYGTFDSASAREITLFSSETGGSCSAGWRRIATIETGSQLALHSLNGTGHTAILNGQGHLFFTQKLLN